MQRHTVWGVASFLAGCGASISGSAPTDAASDADAVTMTDAAVDAAIDAPAPLGMWSPPAKIAVAATAAAEDDVTLSSNTLEMVFAVATASGKDLYYARRASKDAEWIALGKLPFDTDTTSEETPRFSADDSTLYFASDRAGNGTLDIYTAAHTAAGTWGDPVPLASVNSDTLIEKWFMPCGKDRYVMAQGLPGSGTDLVEGTLGGGPPLQIGTLNSPNNDTAPFVTQDCLTIYFASNRSGKAMIYTSRRAAATDAWPPPSPVRDFAIAGSTDNQEDPWLSSDGRTFAFSADRDIYISTR